MLQFEWEDLPPAAQALAKEPPAPCAPQWHSFKNGSALVLDTAGLAAKRRAIQSAVWGAARLRFLHFLLGRRERRG